MFNAQPFSPVSTGFTSGTSMLPTVSSVGVEQVSKMSVADTMQEVFFDIRDGIDNLTKTFSNKISGLNKHLAFRLETLNNTMSNIGSVAKKDLGLEQVQTKIAKEDLDLEKKTFAEFKENNEEDERDESLKTKPKEEEKGPGILASLKDAFGGLLDKLTPKSTLGKLGLLGAAGALLMMNFDAVTNAIGKAAKYFKETIVPKAKVFYEDMKETTIGVFDGLFEKDKGLFPLIGKGLAEIRDGFKEDDPVKKLKGMKTIFVDGTIKTISVLGDAVFGTLNASAKAIGMDTPGLRKLQLQFRNLPETIDAFVLRSVERIKGQLKEISETESLPEAALVTARQIYDDLAAPVLNSLNKVLAITLKTTGIIDDEYYNNLMKADFSTTALKAAIKNDFEKLGKVFDTMRDSVRVFSNEIIDQANEILPGFMKINKIPKKDDQFEIDYLASMEEAKLKSPEQYEPGGFMYKKYQKQRSKVIAIDPSVVIPDGPLEETFGVNFDLNEIIDGTAVRMKDKTKEIKDLTNQDFGDTVGPNNYMIADNKQITTTTDASTVNIVSDQRVDSLETSQNALLDFFKR